MKTLDDKLLEYEKRFDESFPNMCFMGVADSEIEKVIDKFLLENKPCEIEMSDDIRY